MHGPMIPMACICLPCTSLDFSRLLSLFAGVSSKAMSILNSFVNDIFEVGLGVL